MNSHNLDLYFAKYPYKHILNIEGVYEMYQTITRKYNGKTKRVYISRASFIFT